MNEPTPSSQIPLSAFLVELGKMETMARQTESNSRAEGKADSEMLYAGWVAGLVEAKRIAINLWDSPQPLTEKLTPSLPIPDPLYPCQCELCREITVWPAKNLFWCEFAKLWILDECWLHDLHGPRGISLADEIARQGVSIGRGLANQQCDKLAEDAEDIRSALKEIYNTASISKETASADLMSGALRCVRELVDELLTKTRTKSALTKTK